MARCVLALVVLVPLAVGRGGRASAIWSAPVGVVLVAGGVAAEASAGAALILLGVLA